MTPVSAVFKAMLAKDVRRELRSKEIFISGFLFSIILLCAIYIAVTAGNLKFEKMGTGAIWLCILFTGTVSMNRIHQSETANGCYRGLILAPVEGGWLYLSKVCANLLLLGFSATLLVPLTALFFQLDVWANLPYLLASLYLGILAFVAVGTMVVVITANTRMKDVLFPLVQLPLVVPVLIGGVNSTAVALEGKAPWDWLQMLLAMNVVFLSLGFLLYEFLLEE
ncbi:MAG: heme exporter protein CcmB [Acidobacteriota bacterium]|nr:heme exporter protein CcmB [Acidobacteriota bacterium]